MEYAPHKYLRKNLHSIALIDWKEKSNLLQCIALDLQIIHFYDLIRRAHIADLGLSITANIALKLKSDRICKILPYIAPEVWNNKQYTKASDIYLLGIVMWEIYTVNLLLLSQNPNLKTNFI